MQASLNNTLYYLMLHEQRAGPYTIGQLRSMWQSGAVTTQTQYWFEGAESWQPLIKLRTMLEPAPVQPVIAVASPIITVASPVHAHTPATTFRWSHQTPLNSGYSSLSSAV